MIRPGSPASESLMLLSDAVSVKKHYEWPFEQFNLSYISGLIEGVWSVVSSGQERKGKRNDFFKGVYA